MGGVAQLSPDGTAIRDYIHVTDLATAHVLALEQLTTGGDPFVCNLGTGAGFSVMQVIDAVRMHCGLEVPFEWAPRRQGDPGEVVADASLATATLDWRPRHSSLESTVSTAIAWHRDIKPGF